MEFEEVSPVIGTPHDGFNLVKATAAILPTRASGDVHDNSALIPKSEMFTFGNSLDSRLFDSLLGLTMRPGEYAIRFEANLLIPSWDAANIPEIIRNAYGDFYSVSFQVADEDSHGRIPVRAAITKIVFGWLTPSIEHYARNPLLNGYIG